MQDQASNLNQCSFKYHENCLEFLRLCQQVQAVAGAKAFLKLGAGAETNSFWSPALVTATLQTLTLIQAREDTHNHPNMSLADPN